VTCARNWRLLLNAEATKARNLNLLAESELALAINFYAVSFLNWEKSGLKNVPYSKSPASGRSRWDQGLSAAEMKRCHWVKPVMVCQIKFTEWTRDDRLRQPVFLGFREDKNANEGPSLGHNGSATNGRHVAKRVRNDSGASECQWKGDGFGPACTER
jgi:hypothetical protein